MPAKSIIIVIATVVILAAGAGVVLLNQFATPKVMTVYVSAVKGASNSFLVKDGFQPKEITLVIGVNNTVTWTNDDPGVVHTVHSDLPEFDSGILDPGKSFAHTFTKPGTYTYHCDPHPWMLGKVVVKNAS